MDLPVFRQNLRSSASWLTDLEKESVVWKTAAPEARDRARALQVEHAIRRSSSHDPLLIARYREVAELVSGWAAEKGATLDASMFKELHQVLSGSEEMVSPFRTGEARKVGEYHDPAPAVILPRLVDNAIDWFQTPSFGEIHPVEQAAIVHLRVLDLQPFASFNDEVASLTASFYLERSSHPALVLFADEEARMQYDSALEAAFRMLTQPLVELLSASLVRTIRLALA